MITKTKLGIAILLTVSVLFIACKDDKKDPDPGPGNGPVVLPKLTIEMDHLAGSQKFYLDSTYYTEDGDPLSFSMFKYYVSNFRLIRTDNSEYAIAESYFLVNQEDPASMTITMDSLQPGEFKSVKFILGVDSARNTSGAQTGALDPIHGMLWDWNTGYIFFKMEGNSQVIPTSQEFTYHIGGFQGNSVNYREIELSFDGDILPLALNKNPELHIVMDMLEIFKNPVTIDIETFPSTIMSPTPSAGIIADNYEDIFTYDHMHTE